MNLTNLDQELKTACDSVRAISIAQHCDPYAVFVHVSKELTPEERQTIESIIASHKGETGEFGDGRF